MKQAVNAEMARPIRAACMNCLLQGSSQAPNSYYLVSRNHQFFPRADLTQAAVDPLLRQLLLDAVLREARAESVPIHVIERLVLIKAGEYHGLFSSERILVKLEALRADLFHHALHWRVDASDRFVIGFEIRSQNCVACASHGTHHGIGPDDHQTVYRIERDFRFVQIAASVGGHRFYNVSDEGLVLDAARRETWRLIAAPYGDVRGFLDLFHLVAVDDLLVTRKIDGARSAGAKLLADREKNGVAQAASYQQDRFLLWRFRGSPGRAHEDHRFAGLEQRT